jgi:hypothetical protein
VVLWRACAAARRLALVLGFFFFSMGSGSSRPQRATPSSPPTPPAHELVDIGTHGGSWVSLPTHNNSANDEDDENSNNNNHRTAAGAALRGPVAMPAPRRRPPVSWLGTPARPDRAPTPHSHASADTTAAHPTLRRRFLRAFSREHATASAAATTAAATTAAAAADGAEAAAGPAVRRRRMRLYSSEGAPTAAAVGQTTAAAAAAAPASVTHVRHALEVESVLVPPAHPPPSVRRSPRLAAAAALSEGTAARTALRPFVRSYRFTADTPAPPPPPAAAAGDTDATDEHATRVIYAADVGGASLIILRVGNDERRGGALHGGLGPGSWVVYLIGGAGGGGGGGIGGGSYEELLALQERLGIVPRSISTDQVRGPTSTHSQQTQRE